MYDFFTNAAILLWSIIGTIVGGAALLAVIILIGHELWVIASSLAPTNPENEENDS
jgi:uncharacterized membrane protein